MSAVYLFPLESVKPLGEHFISMENMARVKNSSLEAVVEMATDLDLWKIVKQNVTQRHYWVRDKFIKEKS